MAEPHVANPKLTLMPFGYTTELSQIHENHLSQEILIDGEKMPLMW